ncbi:zinc finger BED domain-containing protein RICESLEEPER 2 [Tanacetum coccineum]|uniref:Zinc finger BED domain-containing protein RICESLEEPER 2 n=1 Tax=Tanacetum coccineum TaxID=301880 RepID=A0ABQ5GD15_9ASTR
MIDYALWEVIKNGARTGQRRSEESRKQGRRCRQEEENFLDKSVGLTTLVDRRGNLGIDNNSRTVETRLPLYGSNTTLRSHITRPHCEAIKAQQNQNPASSQMSMAQDGSVFRYDPDYLREQFAGLVGYQREYRVRNHFDHEQTTRVFQNTLQPRSTHDFVTHLHPKEFATFDVLGFWKEKETMYPVLSRMAMDIISVQASSVASESTFSTSERVLSIRRTRLTPTYLEM